MSRWLMAAPTGCKPLTPNDEVITNTLVTTLARCNSPGSFVAERRFGSGAELVAFINSLDDKKLRNQHGLLITATISEKCWIEAIRVLRTKPINEIYSFLWNLYLLRGQVIVPHTVQAHRDQYKYRMTDFKDYDIATITQVICGAYGKGKRQKVIYVNSQMIIK